MSHDDYFNQLQTESAIRSARLQIERAREMLRLSRELIRDSRANFPQSQSKLRRYCK